jgi:nickel-type superoxide dismutase maturation protease
VCKLLKVTGDSLSPEVQEGDFVLVCKIPFLFAHPRPGDVVAFRNANYGTMIKRIEAVTPDRQGLFVVGTHPHSVDSRRFGTVPRHQIIGKVIWHIHK